MLIINADDWGGWKSATDAALTCYKAGRINSVSAMVFMEDSERASHIAKELGMDVGLHLNLSQRYNGRQPSPGPAKSHQRVVRFMSASKYSVLLYHPGLRREFQDVYQSQLEEFARLYGGAPSHVDGHQHKHLCLNMLIGKVIPRGQKVRRSFSFRPEEKGCLNRTYRRFVDRCLGRRYVTTDYFFTLAQCWSEPGLVRLSRLAKAANVELMVHPARAEEYTFLMGNSWLEFLHTVGVSRDGAFARLT
jgi:predicted glycoside hydrolase/deacetylase ChbG (UPF0249 family)